MPSDTIEHQRQRRERLFALHRGSIDRWWHADGSFRWPQAPDHHGGLRAILWHCLSYLGGDPLCVAKANRIIRAHYTPGPCHFAPGAAIDVLLHHRERLEADVRDLLLDYLRANLHYMSTEDLKIHGYNDNHPFKAMHALVVGGEMLGLPRLVETGLHKLRQAVAVYARNGFPCEYNSPNYAPVSLNPLANLVEQAANPEARALALRLERYVWQDVAVHFDPRAGLPAGPLSRGYVHDYIGKLSGTVTLLQHLFPERFACDAAEEIFTAGADSRLLDAAIIERSLPFLAAHPIWYASATYHYDQAIERALFERPAGTCVRGTAESGTNAITWKDPAQRPEGAPHAHHIGPRRSLLTTWYGRRCSLGTSQYAWLDNGQAHGFLATIAGARDGDLAGAAVYYARMFFDERCPYGDVPFASACFRDDGEIRTIQHQSTALVLYQPHPLAASFKRLRTGLFRPLHATRPRQVFIGEDSTGGVNMTSERLLPVAIDEGEHYVGLIPLRLTDRGQARKAHLQVLWNGEHLSVLISSFEGWGPQSFTYEAIVETGSGFAFELHEASRFASFADFRRFLAAAQVADDWYADMRTTTYRREGLELATCYSPYQSAFRFAAVDGAAVEMPTLAITGMPDPGHGHLAVAAT